MKTLDHIEAPMAWLRYRMLIGSTATGDTSLDRHADLLVRSFGFRTTRQVRALLMAALGLPKQHANTRPRGHVKPNPHRPAHGLDRMDRIIDALAGAIERAKSQRVARAA